MSWYGTEEALKLKTIDKSKILVFDVETTGIQTKSDEVLQISILDGNGKTLYSSFIKPIHHKEWPNAQKINGISPEMVNDAPTLRQAKKEIQELFDNAQLVVGYNVSFDIGFVKAAGITVPDKHRQFDVMRDFTSYRSGIGDSFFPGNYKLKECADYFGYSYNPHNANEDAKAALFCFNSMISDERFYPYEKTQERPQREISIKEIEEEKQVRKEEKREQREERKEERKERREKRDRAGVSTFFRTLWRFSALIGLVLIIAGIAVLCLISGIVPKSMDAINQILLNVKINLAVDPKIIASVIAIALGCLLIIVRAARRLIKLLKWLIKRRKLRREEMEFDDDDANVVVVRRSKWVFLLLLGIALIVVGIVALCVICGILPKSFDAINQIILYVKTNIVAYTKIIVSVAVLALGCLMIVVWAFRMLILLLKRIAMRRRQRREDLGYDDDYDEERRGAIKEALKGLLRRPLILGPALIVLGIVALCLISWTFPKSSDAINQIILNTKTSFASSPLIIISVALIVLGCLLIVVKVFRLFIKSENKDFMAYVFSIFMNWFNGICAPLCGIWMMLSGLFNLTHSFNNWIPLIAYHSFPFHDLLFTSHFWPGLALLLVIGVPNIFAVISRFRDNLARWSFLCLLEGVLLIIWGITELAFFINWISILSFVFGVLQFAAARRVRRETDESD